MRSELKIRRDTEISLQKDLDKAAEEYDEAIRSLQKSKAEKDALKDQVERLQWEVDRERKRRQALQEDIDVNVRQEEDLLEMLRRARQMEIRETTVPAERQRISQPREAAPKTEETRTDGRRMIDIHVHGKSESRVSWHRKVSSKDRKKGRKA